VAARAADFTQDASRHRLNQVHTCSQSASLQAASQVNMKMAALRRANKADAVTVQATLWSLPVPGSAARKVS
jgi:hypothetical protein